MADETPDDDSPGKPTNRTPLTIGELAKLDTRGFLPPPIKSQFVGKVPITRLWPEQAVGGKLVAALAEAQKVDVGLWKIDSALNEMLRGVASVKRHGPDVNKILESIAATQAVALSVSKFANPAWTASPAFSVAATTWMSRQPLTGQVSRLIASLPPPESRTVAVATPDTVVVEATVATPHVMATAATRRRRMLTRNEVERIVGLVASLLAIAMYLEEWPDRRHAVILLALTLLSVVIVYRQDSSNDG